MKKILKSLVLTGLLCAFISSAAMAGNTAYSRYNLSSSGYTWQHTWSYNTKATTKANWFMYVEKLNFGGGKTSGTLGMAYTPMINGQQAANVHWALAPHSNWVYTGWGNYNGSAGNRYELGVRMDSLITGVSSAYTVGQWNSN